jgi:hypothetical protein
MTTVRQLQRFWESRKYDQIYAELTASRSDCVPQLRWECPACVPAAAMAIIRLDELDQSHVPLAPKLIRALLATQQPDGGWGDLMATALALRALTRCRGQGLAIERGMAYLANLQQPQGIWPKVPIRRMPADAQVSAFILHQLGDVPAFRAAVRFDDAVRWFARNDFALDENTRRLWNSAQLKCRIADRAASALCLYS